MNWRRLSFAALVCLLVNTSVFSLPGQANILPECEPLSSGNWRNGPVSQAIAVFKNTPLDANASDLRSKIRKHATRSATGGLRDLADSIRFVLSLLEERGAEPRVLAGLYNNLSAVYRRAGYQCQEGALDLINKAIDLMPKEDAEHSILQSNKAAVLVGLERYEEAIGALSLAVEKLPPPVGKLEIEARAAIINNSAVLYRQLSAHEKAEFLYRHELRLLEKPEIATQLDIETLRLIRSALQHNLAVHLAEIGERHRVGSLLNDAVSARLDLLGRNHDDTAASLRARARHYLEYEHDLDLAERDIEDASVTGLGGPRTQIDKARILRLRGRSDEAIAILDALIWQVAESQGSLAVLAILHTERGHAQRLGDQVAALQSFERAWRLWARARGPESPMVAGSLVSIAELKVASGDLRGALQHARQAVGIYEAWLDREARGCREGDPPSIQHVVAAVDLTIMLEMKLGEDSKAAPLVWYLFQLGELDRTGSAAKHAAYRRDKALATELQKVGAIGEKRCRLEQAILVSRNRGETNQSAILELEKIEAEERTVIATLSPTQQSAALVASGPEPLSAIRSRLRDGELLIAYRASGVITYSFYARKTGESLEVGYAALEDLPVEALKKSLSHLRNAIVKDGVALAQIRPELRSLAEGLLRGVPNSILQSASHVIVVSDGPLDQFPLGLLVSVLRADSKQSPVSIMPSIASFIALGRGLPIEGKRKYAGFGDPSLSPVQCPALERPRTVQEEAFCLGQVSTTEILLEQTRLVLGAPKETVFRREKAIPANLDGAVRDAGVVVLATHAVTAHELPTLEEPAIIVSGDSAISKPTEAAIVGLSDIQQLPLQSAWLVVLSTCDSAASDGLPRAEGYTGLARAFLYAGARAVILTHWKLDGADGARLLGQMLKAMASDSSLSIAEALAHAMSDHSQSSMIYWAPFSILGDGASRMAASR